MKRSKLNILIGVSLFLTSYSAYCTNYYTKQWNSATIMGSFSENNKFKYYLEPQLRFANTPYVFNQSLFLAGLGYEVLPNLILLAGPGWSLTKAPENGDVLHQYRLWEQASWEILGEDKPFILNSRTRFEQLYYTEATGIDADFRERLWARIPIKNSDHYYYSTFEEAFFSLNQPSWDRKTTRSFYQNRAFVGFAKRIQKNTFVDFGYMNQLQLLNVRQMSNVVFVSVNAML